jgi:hypothetical protein
LLPAIAIEQKQKGKPVAKMPPLDPALIGPMEALSAKYFPGVPVIPSMSTGATDGLYMSAVDIPTYGVPVPGAIRTATARTGWTNGSRSARSMSAATICSTWSRRWRSEDPQTPSGSKTGPGQFPGPRPQPVSNRVE